MPHFTPNWSLPYDDPSDLPGLAETGGPNGTSAILAVVLDGILTTIDTGTQNITNEFNTFAASLGTNRTVEVFTTDGIWNPNPDADQYVIRAMGGGGAGGGAAATGGSTNYSMGAGGASGSTISLLLDASEVGASHAVTVGAGGTPVSGGTGNTGGVTEITGVFSCPGGAGGTVLSHTDSQALVVVLGISVLQVPTNPDTAPGVQGPGMPTVSVGTTIIASPGIPSEGTWSHPPAAFSGTGASTIIGGGGLGHRESLIPSQAMAGNDGTGNGAGGGGAIARGASSAQSGGSGSPGVVVIESFFTEASVS